MVANSSSSYLEGRLFTASRSIEECGVPNGRPKVMSGSLRKNSMLSNISQTSVSRAAAEAIHVFSIRGVPMEQPDIYNSLL